MLRLITILVCLIMSLATHAAYVQDRDLISLHYDHAPDKDDGHATVAALAVVTARGINPHVVSGAYGTGNSSQYQSGAEAVMQATWGSEWVDAHANWQSAVNVTAALWRSTLVNGGDIWVAEGGQSDFTADVVRSIANSNPSIDTRTRIHVVQHSTWNEQQSNQTDFNYSRSNTDYIKIADGNGVNATADLNQKSDSFVQLARASQFGSAWNAAFSYLNPNNKLDFSDTVELLHILDIGKDQIATVNDFASVFLDQSPTPVATSPTEWSDSYSVNGQCYCDSTFDHGLASVTVDTPVGTKSVQQVCADISTTFGTGNFDNRVYYNTVQCGHGPVNSVADETTCPGIPRDVGDYTGTRCNQTGATWNLDQLYAVPDPEPVVPEPEPVVPEPEPEPEPEQDPQNQTDTQEFLEVLPGVVFPVCSSSVTDNGDGYGWENNQTCAFQAAIGDQEPQDSQQSVAPTNDPLISFPVCSANVIDYDGDGYEWENNQTCVVQSDNSTSTTQDTQQSVAPIDNPLINFPVCSANVIDFDGDGYGWENFQTCVVQSDNSTSATQQSLAPIDNPLINFPVCSANVIDFDGDGYGWENFQTCVVQSDNSTSATQDTQQSLAPIDNPLINFPVCSANVIDFDGDGYGWANFQTCVIQTGASTAINQDAQQTVAPIDNPLVFFPVCSANSVDENGDGYGWENFQTCVINTSQ